MKTSTHAIAPLFLLLLTSSYWHLSSAQSTRDKSPCEKYAQRVDELSRACKDNICKRHQLIWTIGNPALKQSLGVCPIKWSRHKVLSRK